VSDADPATNSAGTDADEATNPTNPGANPTNPGADATNPQTEDPADATNPWPETAADAIVDAVSSLRQLALRPVARIARRIVYGLLVAVLAMLLFLFSMLGLVRLLDAYIPQEVWLTYAILGGVLTLAGLLVWSRRPRGAAS